MKSRNKPFVSRGGFLAGLLLAATVVLQSGCESSDGTESPVEVAPPSVTLRTGSSASMVFTASGGLAPYRWTVSDATLGKVSSSSQVAVYTRTAAAGINIITATDTNGFSARAMIYQDTTP